jgi:hypothetical protein
MSQVECKQSAIPAGTASAAVISIESGEVVQTGVPESQSPYQSDLDNYAASLASMAMTSAAVAPAGAIIAPGDLLAHARSLTTDQVLDYINVGWRGICVKLLDLAPYIEVCFERIENSEEVAGYTSKKEFCKNVLNKTYGAVKFMLEANRRHDAEHAQASLVPAP